MSDVTKAPIEKVVLDVVSSFVSRRLSSKYDQSWDAVKAGTADKDEYNEKRTKVAKDAFLAVRARTGADFIDYFVSTLCSVPQHMSEATFTELSQALYQETDRIRTLTLLALSARS